MIAACTCWVALKRSGPDMADFGCHRRRAIKSGVRFTRGRAGQVRSRILERQRQLQLLAQRVRVADLRLPEERDGVQSLEVEADRLGFGIGERGPRLTDDPAVGLHEGVPEPERVLAAGEVALDEGSDRRALERRAQIECRIARPTASTPSARPRPPAGRSRQESTRSRSGRRCRAVRACARASCAPGPRT